MTTPTGAAAPSLAGLRLELTVHAGRNLIAKDRRGLSRRKGTSDPYVKISFVWGSRATVRHLGDTRVVPKTTDPSWEHTVSRALGASDAESVRRGAAGGRPWAFFSLAIYDKDKLSDDPMGVVTIPASCETVEKRYFPVEKGRPGSAHYCRDAKGELLVSLRVQPKEMPRVVRGNVVPLPADPSRSKVFVGLGWDLVPDARGGRAPVDLDVSCVAIGTAGQLLMKETVYYGNLRNTNGSVVHSGDEREGDEDLGGSGDDERISLDLRAIPPSVRAYVLVATVATPGMDFSRVASARVRVVDGRTGAGICSYAPAYEGANTALFVLRIARESGSVGVGGWSLGTIGDVDQTARDFGSLLPQIKGYCRDLVPGTTIDPHERVAIMSKGSVVRIQDFTPVKDVIPDPLTLGLAWDVTRGRDIDLDASAVCLSADHELVDVVYFKHLHSDDGAIHHSGDEREGDEVGDDEKIIVSLANLNPRVERICFVLNSYSGQELDDVARASCHLFDPRTRRDLASYALSNNRAVDKHTALLLADVYRDAASREWCMRVLSVPSQGRVAKQCMGHLVGHLRQHPPPPPAIPPEPEIVVNAMPAVVAVDEEISFVPFDQDIVVGPIP